jgi:hypothetical protein
VSSAVITLCIASQRVFVVYFVMTESGNFWIYPRVIAVDEWVGVACDNNGFSK